MGNFCDPESFLLCDEIEEHGLTEDRRFNATYELNERDGQLLGQGTFSTVHLCWKRGCPEIRFALKAVNTWDSRILLCLRSEIISLQLLEGHPRIVNLLDVFESFTSVRLILELCEGGDLFDRIKQKRWYAEQEAKVCCQNLFEALAYVHGKRIMHRDLKPENILLQSRTNDTDIKLSDFGLSQISVSPGGPSPRSRATVGSRFYQAPELIKQEEYGQEVDVWAAGVIAYCLLCGSLPFFHQEDEQLYQKILQQGLTFPQQAWTQTSSQASTFIRRTLQARAENRPTADSLLHDAWLMTA